MFLQKIPRDSAKDFWSREKLSIRLTVQYSQWFLVIFMSTDTRSAGHFPLRVNNDYEFKPVCPLIKNKNGAVDHG